MSADHDAHLIAAEVMTDFRRMFPGAYLSAEQSNYLESLIQRALADALRGEENDWR